MNVKNLPTQRTPQPILFSHSAGVSNCILFDILGITCTPAGQSRLTRLIESSSIFKLEKSVAWIQLGCIEIHTVFMLKDNTAVAISKSC